ncbi:MAG: hypothetical protein ACI8ZM_002935 [Crocinitomix sp.]
MKIRLHLFQMTSRQLDVYLKKTAILKVKMKVWRFLDQLIIMEEKTPILSH